jgi:hypothetical protein
MSFSEAKKRLMAKLSKQRVVNPVEQNVITKTQKRLAKAHANIRKKIDKSVKKKRFNNLEYVYFTKHHFVQYLYMMADSGYSFYNIDQRTVDSIELILRDNDSYEEFVSALKQDWMKTDGVMRAFKYLFECKISR